jgi:hypothetical protein
VPPPPHIPTHTPHTPHTPHPAQDTYGPPLGKRLVLFLDDLSMPRLDKYGTQQPLALLKLFIERKGMYDRGKELCWKNVKDVQVRAAWGVLLRRGGAAAGGAPAWCRAGWGTAMAPSVHQAWQPAQPPSLQPARCSRRLATPASSPLTADSPPSPPT